MNVPYYPIAFGAVLFGVLIALCVIRAHHSKERAYYIGGLVSGLMLLALISAFLLQFILFIVFVAAAFIVSVVGFPKIGEAILREAVTQRQETNVSEPLKARELLTWKGWFKLSSQFGVRKTMYVYILFNMGITGTELFILSIVGLISALYAPAIVIIVAGASIVLFRRQIEKNLLETI